MLGARYHFNPEGRWNWFVMAALGGTSVTKANATDQQRSDATRPSAELGVGLERRFRHFAIQAELRGLGIAEPVQDKTMSVPPPPLHPEPGSTPPVNNPTTPVTSQQQQGGTFTLGVSYYF